MGWYNAGSWAGLDGTTIPFVLAELCNAVNERRDCLGVSRISWVVNTGTEASPTVGTKSANLDETDFFGLDLIRHDHLQDIYGEVGALVGQTGIQSTTHCAGFAKTSTNTAVGTDLWTLADIATDSGYPAINPVRHTFDEAAANFLRAALDRLIYPVVWPSNYVDLKDQDVGPGVRTYHYKGSDGSFLSNGSASAAYADMVQDTVTSFAADAALQVSASANSTTPPGYGFTYQAAAFEKTILEIAPRSGGYPGSITKAWATVFATYGDVASGVSFDVMGETLTVSGTSAGTGGADELDKVDLDVSSGNFSLSGATNPEITLSIPGGNPFDGESVFENPDPATGIGGAGVRLACKYDQETSFETTNSGTLFTRLIVDISGELADQA